MSDKNSASLEIKKSTINTTIIITIIALFLLTNFNLDFLENDDNQDLNSKSSDKSYFDNHQNEIYSAHLT